MPILLCITLKGILNVWFSHQEIFPDSKKQLEAKWLISGDFELYFS